jgi:CheY-like chemotaxis protein
MAGDIDVLLVDEDTEMLDLTETFLQRESDRIRVTTEQSANAAVERVQEEEFDCVVSDLRMPEMDGGTLCNRIHEDDPDVPVFLFTAATGDDVSEQVGDADVVDVIRKGTGTDHYTDLADGIEAAVDGR